MLVLPLAPAPPTGLLSKFPLSESSLTILFKIAIPPSPILFILHNFSSQHLPAGILNMYCFIVFLQ